MTTTTARRATWHLRLWVGLGIAVPLLFAPGLSGSEGLILSAATLVYVLGATVFDAVAARRPGFPARILTPLLGLAVIELVIIAIPRALAAGLVLFLLVATVSTNVGSPTWRRRSIRSRGRSAARYAPPSPGSSCATATASRSRRGPPAGRCRRLPRPST